MTPEQLSKWASIAEISSSLAILATLILLLIEIRQNTQSIQQSAEATRLTALDSGVEQYTAFRRMLLSDDALLELWENGCNRELEPLETLKYTQLAQQYFFLQRNVYERSRALRAQPQTAVQEQTVARIMRCPNLRAEFDRTLDVGADQGWFAAIRDELESSDPGHD
jgi:hypothetical protein